MQVFVGPKADPHKVFGRLGYWRIQSSTSFLGQVTIKLQGFLLPHIEGQRPRWSDGCFFFFWGGGGGGGGWVFWMMFLWIKGIGKCRYIYIYGCFQKWWYLQIIHFNRVFHCKPSILGYPSFWKHPYIYINLWTPKPWKIQMLSPKNMGHNP